MRVSLCFPFRDTDGSRSHAYGQIRPVLESFYDFSFILECDASDYHEFNRAATRNLAVSVSESYGMDVVVICDADSLPEKTVLLEAIHAARDDGLIHFPFNEVWALSPHATHKLGTATFQQLHSRIITRSGESKGGVFVCRPEAWWRAGGQDHRFTGWGCEDRGMILTTETFVGRSVSHPGILLTAHHDRLNNVFREDDLYLLSKYQFNHRNVLKTLEVIDGRSDYTSAVVREAQISGPTL